MTGDRIGSMLSAVYGGLVAFPEAAELGHECEDYLDDGEDWLEDVRREADPCPRCQADAARRILCGMPAGDDFRRLADRAVFAGCCLPEVLWLFSCGECGQEWGRREPEPVEEMHSTFDGR